ncbi:SUMF1/EgtB/PvdO family nonheme iron enzyme [Arthrobacter sp. H35-D1]|uniref:formylglycine-generating enzyme family protein n=1 Tax=Arthrobacter sp. H35-D1 TaxID=3046202 RepID=UPI0024BA6E5C|nr:SUMF1/EgtB/PvdO family nonheme iron enzyme [Arthrobacter sp. H35-D1]MDJ0311669.1 SUMF1/EgtB/PvdO family nonheme iron enzyme [Arthrobacter sp. H35-D1]
MSNNPDPVLLPGDLPSLNAIAGGTIELRDARSASTRTVGLLPFELGRTAVTSAQWLAVQRLATERLALEHQTPQHDVERGKTVPINPVTWFEAVRWCNAASTLAGAAPAYQISGRNVAWHPGSDGFRLPTEAEWEWAARAGTSTPRYGELADIAWTAADHVAGPQPVGGKAANSFGLFDMIGNVWEWCWDYADTARYGDYRSLRGAGWDDPSWSARASVRRGSAPDAILEDVGFRVARGAVAAPGSTTTQGWSADADRQRAAIKGPLPIGWTPLRSLLERSGD